MLEPVCSLYTSMNPWRASPSTPVGAPKRVNSAGPASPPPSPAVVAVPSPSPAVVPAPSPPPQAAKTKASTASRINCLRNRSILSPPLGGAGQRTIPPEPHHIRVVACTRRLDEGKNGHPDHHEEGRDQDHLGGRQFGGKTGGHDRVNQRPGADQEADRAGSHHEKGQNWHGSYG